MKNKSKLAMLKYQAIKLRANYQLPYKLVYYISQLTKDSPVELVRYLAYQSEHMLRVKGYYHKYPKVEEMYDKDVTEDYNKIWAKFN